MILGTPVSGITKLSVLNRIRPGSLCPTRSVVPAPAVTSVGNQRTNCLSAERHLGSPETPCLRRKPLMYPIPVVLKREMVGNLINCSGPDGCLRYRAAGLLIIEKINE